jgi:cullin 2
MQTFQMAILLLFEKTDSLTCKEVQESLQLNSEQFGKHLMSLIESKLLLANMEVINMIVL